MVIDLESGDESNQPEEAMPKQKGKIEQPVEAMPKGKGKIEQSVEAKVGDKKEKPGEATPRLRTPQTKIPLDQMKPILELHLDDHPTFNIGSYVPKRFFRIRSCVHECLRVAHTHTHIYIYIYMVAHMYIYVIQHVTRSFR